MTESCRLLTVDDNEIVSIRLSVILQEAGYRVCSTMSAEGALAAMSLQAFDLLIVDIQMPQIDGFALLELIRERHDGPATPALMLTASEEVSDMNRARKLGARGFLQKPFDQLALVAKVKRVLTSPEIAWIDDHHCLLNAAAGSRSDAQPGVTPLH